MRTMLVFLNLVVGTSLFLAEPPHDPREAWTVAPTWTVGRELVYRGQVRDQNQGRGVHFAKEYALKVRALVLDVDDDGWAHLAGCTRLQQTQQTTAADAVSLVLDQAQVDGLGRSRAAEGNALPPVHPEGPNSREWGFLFELPAATIKLKQTWTLHGPGQPPRQATVQGPVTLGSVPCLLVQVGQQSDDWDQPRADSTAWRVVERLWIGLRNGLMQRVERVIERRAPAHREVTQRITTEYELESQLRYDGLFLEDRRRDIALTLDVQEQLRALRRDTARAGAAPFQTLVARIDASSKQHPATPYREVLIRLRSQAVAGSQNRLPPPVALEGGPAAPVGLAVGRPAPEFAVRALEGQSTLTLRACRGKPTLLAFVQPVSVATPAVLQALQRLHDEAEPEAHLAVFVMGDTPEQVLAQREQLRLTLPLLAGRSLRWSYGVEATPHFVLVDADGTVQALHTGWGPETAAQLERWVKPTSAPR